MAFNVVATPFGRQGTDYPHEHEALAPLGVTITTIQAQTDDEYVAQAKDADAVIAGGRMLSANRARRNADSAASRTRRHCHDGPERLRGHARRRPHDDRS